MTSEEYKEWRNVRQANQANKTVNSWRSNFNEKSKVEMANTNLFDSVPVIKKHQPKKQAKTPMRTRICANPAVQELILNNRKQIA